MNTLTIAVLVICATAAYASAIPPAEELSAPVSAEAGPAEELLQGEESRYYGGGGHYGGGHHGGGHHGGGHHGGGHHGGGHYGGGYGYGRGWGK